MEGDGFWPRVRAANASALRQDRRLIYLTIVLAASSLDLQEDVVEVLELNRELVARITAYLEGRP